MIETNKGAWYNGLLRSGEISWLSNFTDPTCRNIKSSTNFILENTFLQKHVIS